MKRFSKKILSIFIICLIAVISFTVWGAIHRSSTDSFISKAKLDDIHIGVVQSTQNSNIGYISFYDRSLKLVSEKKLPFGDMGDQTRVPCLSNHSFYIVPLGLGNQKDLETIVKFDLKTGKYRTYKIDEPAVLMFTVNNNDVYTTNTLNFIGYITECDTTTGKLDKWEKEGLVISSLKCYDNLLYAWGTINQNNVNSPNLFIFETKPLKLFKQISLEGCGTQQLDSCKIGDVIYFTNNMDIDGNDQSKILSKFNIKTDKIQNIQLKEQSPNQIIQYNNKLYITHCNPLAADLNKITIFDPQTGNQQLVEMKNALVQTIRFHNYLYSQDTENLYVYDINSLKLIKSININKKRKSLTPMQFYIGGFFVK